MAAQIQIFIIAIALFMSGGVAYAQGDFAPYESSNKLEKVAPGATRSASGKKRDGGQDGIVVQDGAAVYEAPNFDAPVMEYLDQGKRVQVSRKIYPGIGGLGAFYKIKLRKGKYGYITDVEVKVAKKGAKKPTKRPPPSDGMGEGGLVDDPSQIMAGLENPEPLEEQVDSAYMTRWLGISYAMYNYTETIANQKKTAATNFLGVKLSGSAGIMGGAPLDLEFIFTTEAPSFYDKIAKSTSGFMILGNALMMIPITEFKSGFLYYGLGLMGKYSKWDVKLKSQANKPSLDSQEFALGAGGELGMAYKITQSIILRLEGKYFWEAEKYFGYDAALQFRY